MYSATLLSWCPIHLAILIVPSGGPSITTPIPDGPGFPKEPPSTWATKSDIPVSFDQPCLTNFPTSRCLSGSQLGFFWPAPDLRPVHAIVQKRDEINLTFMK